MKQLFIRTLSMTAILLLLNKSTLLAQIIQQLPGKWYTNSIIREEGSDTLSKQLMEFIVGKNSFKQLSANHRFVTFDNNAYSYGTWELKENTLRLITDRSGGVFTYKVQKIAGDELLLLIDHKYIHFVKAKDSLAADQKPIPNNTTRFTASKSQLAKKWYYSKTIEPAEKPAPPSLLGDPLKNSWYELREDGTCTRKFTKAVEGNWELTDGGKRLLIIDSNGVGQAWDIVKVSDRQCILQMPNSKSQRVYSTLQISPGKNQ